MAADLQILTQTYDLILWTLNHTSKFPRSHRHTLGNRMEERLYSLLDELVEAKYSRQKSDILRQAALRLEQLRFQFRLAKDLRIIALNSHRHAVSLLSDMGRQRGGWIGVVERLIQATR